MIVMKFGGGCLKNHENLRQVAAIIRSRKAKCLVVVSAIHGMTDKIIRAVHGARKGDSLIQPFIDSFLNDHLSLVNQVIADVHQRYHLNARIQKLAERLKRLLIGIHYTQELTDTLEAVVVSYGERLSALILSGILNQHWNCSQALSSEEIGLITDNQPRGATAIMPAVRAEFQRTLMPLIESNQIPVITGYFGCTPEGKTTTFGRNGSDYSAAVIANAVNAETLELWKDVDGFMSADPEMVENPVRLERLSYQEAAELAYFGAKLIHPRTMEAVSEKNIPIHIRNLSSPDDRGTVIDSRSLKGDRVLKSVTVNRQIAVLRIRGAGVGIKPGIIGRVGAALNHYRINIYSIITSQTCINLLIDEKDARHGLEALNHLREDAIEGLELCSDLALIAVVGEGILDKQGLAAALFSAVSGVNVNVEMISMGASDVAAYFMVQQAAVRKAVRAIHDKFFMKLGMHFSLSS